MLLNIFLEFEFPSSLFIVELSFKFTANHYAWMTGVFAKDHYTWMTGVFAKDHYDWMTGVFAKDVISCYS